MIPAAASRGRRQGGSRDLGAMPVGWRALYDRKVPEALIEFPTTGRPVSETQNTYTEVTLPNDANSLGTLFGGKLMQYVDLAAAISAARHARSPVVTASIDSLKFLRPVQIGQLVVLKSTVNRVFRTSMEVGVKVYVEDLLTGQIDHVSSAYLTFVAKDREGRKVELLQVVPQTDEERRRFLDAGKRRAYRLEARKP
jgi:acyl-CoA hydrolase